ncbi:MAG TPA: shikimate kinase [Gemmatimonadaceae bacterium]|nr:shikimate kinase [Gemmatimonadaceae bacterium]
MEAKKPNVILVGLSGSGKTSIGRAAARELHWPFIDFDIEIEHRQHASIAQIFERHGEQKFRELEQELTRELVTCSGTIMSAGGGWVTNRESVALLRQTGRIIYLRASPELLVARLATARVRRPLLEGDNPLEALTRLYESRRALYEEADLVIDTEVFDRKQLIEQVRQYALSVS